MTLESPIVVVTGCSKGIGLAVVKVLLSRNIRVIGLASSDLSTLAPETQRILNHESVCYCSIDLASLYKTDAKDCTKNLVQSAIDKWNLDSLKISSLILNAAKLDVCLIKDLSMDSLRNLFEINLISSFGLFRDLWPYLEEYAKDNGYARVVYVSSGMSTFPGPAWSGYCCSKAAANMFIACIDKEYDSIIATAVRPGEPYFNKGVVDTPMLSLAREQGAIVIPESSHLIVGNPGEKALDPMVPATGLVKFALEAGKESSGKYFSYDEF